MLAVATSEAILVIDHSTLKRASSTVSPSCFLDSCPTCITWSPDNGSLFLSTTAEIFRYDSGGNLLQTVYPGPPGEAGPIASLVSKDRGSTVIFSTGQQAHVLEVHTGKIVHTFDSHKALVTSLALSNDSSLLATTSASAVHVHNLSHGSHTVLRGIPAGASAITTCSFHVHSRTRLLVAAGTQLLVYDTTRPSGPIKTIPLSKEKSSVGDVVSVVSSPFSKTLVAVATSGGFISLVDLDKEKGLCRTVSLHVPLTSLVFSAEGATLYAGTENGKVLVQDLRTLDKPPRSINVSEKGDRVVSMTMQKKLKPDEVTAKANPNVASKPLLQQDVNKNPTRRTSGSTGPELKVAAAKAKATSPAAARVFSGKGTPGKNRVSSHGSPRPTRARGAAQMSPGVRKVSSGGVMKKVFSPPKAPVKRGGPAVRNDVLDLNMSVRIENLLDLPTAKAKENIAPAGDASEPHVVGGGSAALFGASRTSSRASLRTDASKTRTRTTSSSRPSASALSATSRLRSASGSSASASNSASAAGRVTKSSKGPVVVSRTTSPVAPVPVIPAAYRPSEQLRQSLTPSPDLPDVDFDAPVTPVPARKGKGKEKMSGMGVLGLGTPEVERWVQAGHLKEPEERGAGRYEGKRVGFVMQEGSNDEDHQIPSDVEDDIEEVEVRRGLTGAKEAVPDMAMQISPRRPLPSGSSNWAPVPSPLRNLANPHPSSPRTHAAADLLQTLLRDAMYDFRQETRTELVGLHLDMLRMGRGLRSELRSVVDEFRGEISTLQEENRRLREENERLRRGY